MKLLIVTQTVDSAHPVLGFFLEWLLEIQKHPNVERLHVISLSQPPENATILDGVRITYIGHPNKWVRLLRFWKAIIADNSDTAMVHMTPPWLIAGLPIWMLKGVRKALWYTHGSRSDALEFAVRYADITLTATKEAFPYPHPKVHAIGHGISDLFIATPHADRPAERFSFLAVGRVAPRKRVRETFAFFEKIQSIEPRATLTWIGPSNANDSYLKQVLDDAKTLKFGSFHIGTTRSHQEMHQEYQAHDLLLHLSDTGSLDKVVIESLAAGCPVFSTNTATVEGLGERWGWKEELNADAAREALRRVEAGVDAAERQRIAEAFALTPFVDRLIKSLNG